MILNKRMDIIGRYLVSNNSINATAFNASEVAFLVESRRRQIHMHLMVCHDMLVDSKPCT